MFHRLPDKKKQFEFYLHLIVPPDCKLRMFY